jgi:HSP90 family molecular chaperone
MAEDFTFEISLSVLNHLGRNLYRNFVTVLAEAISNAWDAEANNVWISIDTANSTFSIKDDGVGMTPDDFQNKFLKIGYSKRRNGNQSTKDGRPYIGAKGIGKLALLSCAQRVSIFAKVSNGEFTAASSITSDSTTQSRATTPPTSILWKVWTSRSSRIYPRASNTARLLYFRG